MKNKEKNLNLILIFFFSGLYIGILQLFYFQTSFLASSTIFYPFFFTLWATINFIAYLISTKIKRTKNTKRDNGKNKSYKNIKNFKIWDYIITISMVLFSVIYYFISKNIYNIILKISCENFLILIASLLIFLILYKIGFNRVNLIFETLGFLISQFAFILFSSHFTLKFMLQLLSYLNLIILILYLSVHLSIQRSEITRTLFKRCFRIYKDHKIKIAFKVAFLVLLIFLTYFLLTHFFSIHKQTDEINEIVLPNYRIFIYEDNFFVNKNYAFSKEYYNENYILLFITEKFKELVKSKGENSTIKILTYELSSLPFLCNLQQQINKYTKSFERNLELKINFYSLGLTNSLEKTISNIFNCSIKNVVIPKEKYDILILPHFLPQSLYEFYDKYKIKSELTYTQLNLNFHAKQNTQFLEILKKSSGTLFISSDNAIFINDNTFYFNETKKFHLKSFNINSFLQEHQIEGVKELKKSNEYQILKSSIEHYISQYLNPNSIRNSLKLSVVLVIFLFIFLNINKVLSLKSFALNTLLFYVIQSINLTNNITYINFALTSLSFMLGFISLLVIPLRKSEIKLKTKDQRIISILIVIFLVICMLNINSNLKYTFYLTITFLLGIYLSLIYKRYGNYNKSYASDSFGLIAALIIYFLILLTNPQQGLRTTILISILILMV